MNIFELEKWIDYLTKYMDSKELHGIKETVEALNYFWISFNEQEDLCFNRIKKKLGVK